MPCRACRVKELRRRPLHRASRAPCARAARDHRTDLARRPPHRPRPSSPLLPQLVPDPAGGLYGSAVSLATPPTLSLSFLSRVATARGSHARTAADLVADVLPATLRPQDGVHLAHRVPQHLASHSTSLTDPSSAKFIFDRTPVAAKVVAGANSGHPDPNGLHQELRLLLRETARTATPSMP